MKTEKIVSETISWVAPTLYGKVKDVATHTQKDMLMGQLLNRLVRTSIEAPECEQLLISATQDISCWSGVVCKIQPNELQLLEAIKNCDGVKHVLCKTGRELVVWIVSEKRQEPVFDQITDIVIDFEIRYRRSVEYIYVAENELKQIPEHDIKV